MTTRFAVTVSTLILALSIDGCASPPQSGVEPAPGVQAAATGEDELPPPGYGTLRQDDFTISFRSADVQIKLTPLGEEVIRLAAPDTYGRLHGLVESRRGRIQEIIRRAGLRDPPRVFLVSFFTRERQLRFEPTDLQIFSQGIQYRPLGIIPLTPGWGSGQLKQEVTESALYVFAPEIDMDVGFRVEYTSGGTAQWGQIVRVLEAERGRVRARAKS